MCKFFSFISDPTKPVPERFKYFNWEQRQDFMSGTIKEESPDSHTSIAHFYGYSAKQEDSLNKYEFNPTSNVFKVDQINSRKDDSAEADKWVRDIDFKTIVSPLIIKPIINPFEIPAPKITPEILAMLNQWASVRGSVWNSVWNSVRDSVWASVGNSVGKSVWASVWDSVGKSVWDSVGNSVGASVGDSVWNSVRDSVWAYISSFFQIKYAADTSPAIKLWEMGLVSTFNGTLWRLHGGPEAKILWEGEI
jgi:hypothetical protein